jgi:hypothetical protein
VTDPEADRLLGEHDAEIRQIQQKQGEINQKVKDLNDVKERCLRCEKEIADTLNNLKQHRQTLLQKAVDMKQETVIGESFQPRLDEINQAKLAIAADKVKNAALRTWTQQRSGVFAQQKRAEEAQEFASKLDETIDSIRVLRSGILNRGTMPVQGLSYVDGKFLFEGFPVENLSTSQAMKLACGLARALAKKTKVICLDGAEALDEVSYSMLKTEIEGDGYNYFITKVGEPFKTATDDAVVEMSNGDARVIQ